VDFRRRGGHIIGMALNITSQQKIAAQWRAAWALLPEEWRRAIADFCLQSDRDVAVMVMRMPTIHVHRPS
jgi:hypothetical protein